MKYTDDLGLRIKHYYEEIPRPRLIRRMPVIIRIDGKSFRTFTKNLKKPFDQIVSMAMMETMRQLCENIQGCVLGYTHSDEITLVLIDYQKLESQAWFDYEVQKLCSVSAAMATLYFNKAFEDYATTWMSKLSPFNCCEDDGAYYDALSEAIENGALFDARCFNIPKEEVTNMIYWRQADAMRNSIQMLARVHFSHNHIQGKTRQEIRTMLEQEAGIDWYTYLPIHLQRGSCCVKELHSDNGTQRCRWVIDNHIPVFKHRGRQYIDRLVFVGDDDHNQL